LQLPPVWQNFSHGSPCLFLSVADVFQEFFSSEKAQTGTQTGTRRPHAV
jgi:hypothetical protein